MECKQLSEFATSTTKLCTCRDGCQSMTRYCIPDHVSVRNCLISSMSLAHFWQTRSSMTPHILQPTRLRSWLLEGHIESDMMKSWVHVDRSQPLSGNHISYTVCCPAEKCEVDASGILLPKNAITILFIIHFWPDSFLFHFSFQFTII